jgi:hypothetical protein
MAMGGFKKQAARQAALFSDFFKKGDFWHA